MIELDDEVPRSDAVVVSRVKGWIRGALELGPDVTIMVTELRCKEPGCPPLETVIAVMRGPNDRWQHKWHKPANTITWADTIHLANLWDRDRPDLPSVDAQRDQ